MNLEPEPLSGMRDQHIEAYAFVVDNTNVLLHQVQDSDNTQLAAFDANLIDPISLQSKGIVCERGNPSVYQWVKTEFSKRYKEQVHVDTQASLPPSKEKLQAFYSVRVKDLLALPPQADTLLLSIEAFTQMVEEQSELVSPETAVAWENLRKNYQREQAKILAASPVLQNRQQTMYKLAAILPALFAGLFR